MNGVFLDSVGVIALIHTGDQWHAAAETAYRQVIAAKRGLVTTSLVLFEVGNALARTRYRQDTSDLWNSLSALGGVVVPTEADCEQGWQLYGRGEAGDAGIVDCISVAVMRRLGLTDAFTNDQHFAAAGFVTLF